MGMFRNPGATIFVPDGAPENEALARISHLAVGAHQDDCEIMAFHGILACYHRADRWFGAVTCTNGSGSPRSGEYAAWTDEEMARLRRREQEKAAIVGNYGLLVQLNYTSPSVKDPANPGPREDLAALFSRCRPEVVYLHNPADKHDTHVAVVLASLDALHSLPAGRRPKRVLGCEVWRSLDWLADGRKAALDVSGHENLASALIGVYDSQVAGGKRYDTATLGRRRANATYYESHATDRTEALWFAMDLAPLVADPAADVAAFVAERIDEFRADVASRIARFAAPRRKG